MSEPTTVAQLAWFPDNEVLLTNLPMFVSPTAPHRTSVVGVSALDGRTYATDKRQVSGEPASAGNEGPIAAVRRDYRGTPVAQTVTAGTIGTSELWAPVPDEFSGICRYPLRWPSAGAPRWHVYHATLEAVLDAELADRAASRGAYVDQPTLAPAQLAQWWAQQAALSAQGLQALATARSSQ